MANNNIAPLLLAAGALLLFRKDVSDTLKGVSTATQGLGSGISVASGGLGSGISDVAGDIADLTGDVTQVTSNIAKITDPIGSIGTGTSSLIDNAFRNIQDPKSKFRQNISSIGSALNPFGGSMSGVWTGGSSVSDTMAKKSSMRMSKKASAATLAKNPFAGTISDHIELPTSSAYNPDGSFKDTPVITSQKSTIRLQKKQSAAQSTPTPKKESYVQRSNRLTRERWGKA